MPSQLEELSRTECMELLARASLGRVGISLGALPAILPVSYRLLDDEIVFRTAPGAKLAAALHRAVVAFEIDHHDADADTGWSVLVVGRALEITEADALEDVRALRLRPWAAGEHDHFVRIGADLISGRRIGPEPRT